ncbi:hypothetical protein BDY19DRAFT_937885 [Irpex rosettiformis]|uniref:Uncharacterized protein n=1 Tax=Irpex rosettiformis TaxID=378272 RepID=A0ACB8U9S1_9APHY|nr:hypothetical protein BDY19DRAFT_937885 [Irpex rosettiformis]
MSPTATKLTLAFLLLGLAGIGNAGRNMVKTNACADECTWMAAQVAGCSAMDIACACTTPHFQSSFRQCVERTCSFTDAAEGAQFFETACASPLGGATNDEHRYDALAEGSDYYGPEVVENVRHGHGYHGHHGRLHHARAEKEVRAASTTSGEATTPSPTATHPETGVPINAGSSVPSSETTSSAASNAPTTTSESSSSQTGGTTSSHSGTTQAHSGTSSQATESGTSKTPSPTHTGTGTTAPNTSPTSPTSSPTPPTSPTVTSSSDTGTPTSAAPTLPASGTTLVVSGSNVSVGPGATGVSINPSIVTPTLPSGHFDPAPTSSGAGPAVKPVVMVWVGLVGVIGGVFVF